MTLTWTPIKSMRLGTVIWIKPWDRRRKLQPHIMTMKGPPFRKLSKKRLKKIMARLEREGARA